MTEKEIKNKDNVKTQETKKVKLQCLHSKEAKECTCSRSKGLVFIK